MADRLKRKSRKTFNVIVSTKSVFVHFFFVLTK